MLIVNMTQQIIFNLYLNDNSSFRIQQLVHIVSNIYTKFSNISITLNFYLLEHQYYFVYLINHKTWKCLNNNTVCIFTQNLIHK